MQTEYGLCPACRVHGGRGVTTQREILQFKPIYLRGCDRHLQMWMAADRADRQRERKRGGN